MLCSTHWNPESESEPSHREVIGICSKCLGYVVMLNDRTQVPTCEKCGAKKKRSLPVVEME